jgi:FtsP/CotA-like multicopper oxidase with cupredoxin domain
VRVTNNMNDSAVTIHFHGLRQFMTWFMDGASGVTMCPIVPGGSFEHRFIADPVGTHWYHEHHRLVYADGLYGMFIVYPQEAILPPTDFLVTIGDWYHQETTVIYSKNKNICGNGGVGASLKPANYSAGCAVDGTDLHPSLYQSALFGGRGRWDDQKFPLSQYVVTQGSTRRFRVVHSGFWFPLEVSVDGHRLRIVALDGGPIDPIVVDSFFIYVGERVDFEVDANQSPGRYWMRARPTCIDHEARAVLVYDSVAASNPDTDPVTTPSQCTAASPCKVFNCHFGRYPDGSNRTCITMNDARSTLTTAELQEEFGVGDPDSEVLTYFLNFAMVVGGSINARRFAFPEIPYFLRTPPPCDPVPCVDGCNCRCTHTLTLPYNRTVQFVVSFLQPNDSIMEAG